MRSALRSAAGVVLLLGLAAAPANADVTITWTCANAAGAQGAQVRVEAIKGHLLREDQGPIGKPPVFSAIRDLKALREFLMWHEFRLFGTNVLRPAAERNDHDAREPSDGKRSHEEALERRNRTAKGVPTGATAKLLGVSCREYRYTAVSIDGAFTVDGTYWMPDDGPGGREYATMYQRLRGLKVGIEEEGVERESRSVQQGGIELQREFMVVARRGGIPYKLEFEVAGQRRKVATREEALKISTATIPPAVFTVPKDYKPRG